MSKKLSTPTTDEMDSTTPDERRALVGWCHSCDAWVKFVRDDMLFQCCEKKDIDTRTIQSQRTFNPKKNPPKRKK